MYWMQLSTDKLLSQSDIQFKPLLQLATKAALAGGLLCAVVADSLFMLMQLAIKAALSEGSLYAVGAGSLFLQWV
jgi:hypothetical protein